MATFYAAGQTAASGENKRLAGNVAAKLTYTAELPYVFVGTEVEGDTIRLIQLPKGTRLKTRQSYVTTVGTLGAAVALDIGDDDGAAGDIDRYSTLLAVTAAGTVVFDTHPDYTLTEQSWITATLTTFTTPAATGDSLTFFIDFVLPAH